MSQRHFLVLIAGGTCAGKSTLAKRVYDFYSKCFGTDDYVTVKVGNIILGHAEKGVSDKQRKKLDENIQLRRELEHEWPKPKNVNWEELLSEVKKELNQTSDAQKIVVVEGIHALQNEELCQMADLKIYSHTDDDKRLILKIKRSPWFKKMVGEPVSDPRNFGGTQNPLPYAFKCWWKGTIESEKKYVIPTQKYADLIITYNETENLPENTELLHVLINLYFNDPQKFQQKLKELKEQGKNGEKERVYASELAVPRAQHKVNSLYDLVKEIKEKKGRKIKLIVDWDDCLQPVKPLAVYKEANPQLSIPFKEFFHNYWEGTNISGNSNLWDGDMISNYQGTEEEKKAVDEFEARRQERKNNPALYLGSFYDSPERFNAPFTSTAKELLQALKEDLVSELVIITSFRKNPSAESKVQEFLAKEVKQKKAKIIKTFGQFPQFKLEYREIQQYMGSNKPHRWEIIQDNHADFDLFVNDNPHQIITTWERLGKDKYYALNDYFHSRSLNAPSIYHVKTTLSDLQDEEIIKAAQEYRTKYGHQQDKTNHQPEQEKVSIYWWLGGALLVVFLLVLVIIRKKRKNVKQQGK